MKRILLLVLIFTSTSKLYSQIGGTRSFAALNLRTSARLAGLSADYLSVQDHDVSLSLSNPSLISSDMHKGISLSFINQFNGINYGSASYAHHIKSIGSFTASVQYIHYGQFQRTTVEEEMIGSFQASEFYLSIGWGRKLDSSFSIGANLKPIFSFYDTYKATAIAIDLSTSYTSKDKTLSISLLANNIGTQLSSFSGSKEKLPFELGIATSKKLANAPFRFYFNATHLQKWDLRFEDPLNPSRVTDFEGNISEPSRTAVFLDNFFRHTLFGMELAFSKSFFFRLGYNYKQARENRLGKGTNVAGLGFGIGVKIKEIEINYSRNNYHLGQSPNYLTITTYLDKKVKKASQASK